MLAITDTPLLKHNPDTFEVIRKEFNLYQPGRMEESVDRLDEWIKAQPHFNKKDFSREFLEIFIITAKGSVEGAKVLIEKLCAYKTFGPQYFSYATRPIDMPGFEDIISCVLPRLTKDHLRIILVKITVQKEYTRKLLLDYFIKTYFRLEYVCKYSYFFGTRCIIDFRKTELSHLIAALKYPEARHGMIPFFKGYGMRLKSLHVITTSKLADIFVSTMGQIISHKMLGRLYVHQNFEEVYGHIEKELFPFDYGGKEKTLKEINDDWDQMLSTDEYMEYIKDMFQATINPDLKPVDKFNDLFLGMQGTFRTLAID